jgi:hypothetical protein
LPRIIVPIAHLTRRGAAENFIELIFRRYNAAKLVVREFTYLRRCLLLGGIQVGKSDEQGKPSEKSLRLLNTSVFGRSTNDAIVLLEPKQPGTIDPETVMVDINDDHYFAATVTYPKEFGFVEARRTLNSRYGKWESANFAKDATMGIWRNEDGQFSMQLTEDEATINLIYIKYSMATDELLLRGFTRAMRQMKEKPTNEREDKSNVIDVSD